MLCTLTHKDYLMPLQVVWVWWAALTTYIIPTIVIFAFWLLIAIKLKRSGKGGKKLKNRTLINMTVITIGNHH